MRILYIGPACSGMTVSLDVISKYALPEFDPMHAIAFGGGCEFGWELNGKLYNICISRTIFRNSISYKSVADAEREPIGKAELDFFRKTDGMVFVVDSQAQHMERNIIMLNKIKRDSAELGLDQIKIPVIFQINKRDLLNIESVQDIKKYLNWGNCSYVESVAKDKVGVIEALNSLILLIIKGKL